MKLPRMRTTTKIVLTLFVVASTMIYCALNQEHEKYTAEANSGDPHDSKPAEEKQCEGEDCVPKKKKLQSIEDYMKENPISDQTKIEQPPSFPIAGDWIPMFALFPIQFASENLGCNLS